MVNIIFKKLKNNKIDWLKLLKKKILFFGKFLLKKNIKLQKVFLIFIKMLSNFQSRKKFLNSKKLILIETKKNILMMKMLVIIVSKKVTI